MDPVLSKQHLRDAGCDQSVEDRCSDSGWRGILELQFLGWELACFAGADPQRSWQAFPQIDFCFSPPKMSSCTSRRKCALTGNC